MTELSDSQLEDFKTWFESQPDYCSYTRVRNFLSGYLGINKSKAEVVMAKLQKNDQIKIIAKKTGNSGRRVFLEPLPELDESHIRAVWDGSPSVSKDINQIAVAVHDMTGHDISDIKEFMRGLESTNIHDKSFKWRDPDVIGDEEEFIR